MTEYKIGSRKSALAMWQANFVAGALAKAHPTCTFPVVGIATMGDKDQMKPLAEFDAKGLFTKELDVAQLDKKIDIAVHCMKDLPTQLPLGLVIAAVLERGDVEDAVVLHAKHKGTNFKDLPEGSLIGTSALRRQAMINRRYPKFKCQSIRGNVNTRLAKLDRGEFDAIILAQIGLKRLEFDNRVSEVLPQSEWGYAVGQGALAIVVREKDETCAGLVRSLNHAQTQMECLAERGMLRTLQGGCKVPIAVRTECSKSKDLKGVDMTTWGAVLSADGKTLIEATQAVSWSRAESEAKTAVEASHECGCQLGQDLLRQGARELLDRNKD